MYVGDCNCIATKRSQFRGLGALHDLGQCPPGRIFTGWGCILPSPTLTPTQRSTGTTVASGISYALPADKSIVALTPVAYYGQGVWPYMFNATFNGKPITFLPRSFLAGDGGLATIYADQATAAGAFPIDTQVTGSSTSDQHSSVGYAFPADKSIPANLYSYVAGPRGGQDLKTLAKIAAIVAAPFVVPAIAAAAGATAAGTASAAGGVTAAGAAAAPIVAVPAAAIAPGAIAVSSGAPVVAAGTSGAVAAGGGILGTGISASTAAGILGAAKTAVSLAQKHDSAAQALTQSAQAQQAAGNDAAAYALWEQANANAVRAQQYQAQSQDLLAPLEASTIGGIPLLWILAGALALKFLL